MPIYGYGTLGAPWTVCNELDKKKLIRFVRIFRDSLESYNTSDTFKHSFKYNTEFEECFMASYDYSKTNIEVYTYQNTLDNIIKNANEILSKNTKYKKYKFDIIGSFIIGKVILMEKK